MQLMLRDNLPFTTVIVSYRGNQVEIGEILVDTGSATTVLAADMMTSIQVIPAPDDILSVIRGVGGNEVVFSRQVDYLRVEQAEVANFVVEVGGMDYGFEINGILGMDFLQQAGAIINLQDLRIEFAV